MATTAAGRSWSETQNLTGTSPSGATEGVELQDATGYTVVVAATSGQTVTGGDLLCWCYDSAVGLWYRVPDNDISLSATAGSRAQAGGSFQVLAPRASRIRYVTSSVTVSGGTTVTVYILCHVPRYAYL